MTGDESRPDSGHAGAACPPAGWREPEWFTDLAGGARARRTEGPPTASPPRLPYRGAHPLVFRADGPHPGRPPAGPGCGHDASQQRGTQRLRHATYNTANTWTQTASMPRNSETEANAAASSTTARNIMSSPDSERTENIVRVLFLSQGEQRWRLRQDDAASFVPAMEVTRPAAAGTIRRPTAGSKRRSGLYKNRPYAAPSFRRRA